jgi:hypothetical protein
MSARIKPHKGRGRELEEVREKDPDGRIVVHHRTVDTLGKMLRSGTIDQTMYDAAKDLQASFIVANLDPLRALPVLRVPGTGHQPELNERQLGARRKGVQCDAGARRFLQSGRLVRLARSWPAAERPRVGDPAGLGRPAGRTEGRCGDPGRGVRRIGNPSPFEPPKMSFATPCRICFPLLWRARR